MKKKSYFRLMLALGALTLALGMNFRFAINDYGIKTSTLSLSVFANVSESSAAKKCKQKTQIYVNHPDDCQNYTIKITNGIDYWCEKGEGTNCKTGFVGTIKDCTYNTTTYSADDLVISCN